MKVTQVISSIDKNSGGTSTYIKLLVEALISNSSQDLIAFNSASNIDIDSRIRMHLPIANKLSHFYSKSIRELLNHSHADIFHGHGLWQYPVHAMAKHASNRNVPYIISTHGMLEPWSLTQSKLKKQLALKLYQANDLRKATCIHATAEMEAENLRSLGFNNPIAVIPNGINLNEYPLKQYSPKSGIKTLLFLSRIHPKKGIELLIEAWAAIAPELKQNWQVKIIGMSDPRYLEQLKQMIAVTGQNNQISIEPPMYGAEKIKAYHEAYLFVLPTFSENFGIVVAEALACGTPVITTQGTPWEDLQQFECGWWIPTSVAALQHSIETALQLTAAELEIMGRKGRTLIEDHYSMDAVAQQMLQLYNWIVLKDEKPNFVYLD